MIDGRPQVHWRVPCTMFLRQRQGKRQFLASEYFSYGCHTVALIRAHTISKIHQHLWQARHPKPNLTMNKLVNNTVRACSIWCLLKVCGYEQRATLKLFEHMTHVFVVKEQYINEFTLCMCGAMEKFKTWLAVSAISKAELFCKNILK